MTKELYPMRREADLVKVRRGEKEGGGEGEGGGGAQNRGSEGGQ
jgi:hypothetical protein